jgi:hypothetical protein
MYKYLLKGAKDDDDDDDNDDDDDDDNNNNNNNVTSQFNFLPSISSYPCTNQLLLIKPHQYTVSIHTYNGITAVFMFPLSVKV